MFSLFFRIENSFQKHETKKSWLFLFCFLLRNKESLVLAGKEFELGSFKYGESKNGF